MTRPLMTFEPIIDCTDVPRCPHCDGDMDSSTVTLKTLLSHWPPPTRVEIDVDGYAHGYQRVVVDCGWCAKPSTLAIDEFRVKLIAMRTDADDRLLRSMDSRR